MLPVTVHTYISASREEIFDLIADLAYRPAWTDHEMRDFRLEHPQSRGKGAASRYLLRAPRYSQWVGTEIIEADRPRRVVEATRGGRYNRTYGQVVFDLSRQGKGLTRVEMTVWSDPGTPREALKEKLGARRWVKRQSKVALERLRAIFEERPDQPLERATVAGWEPEKAPRFGVSPREVSG